MGRNSISKLLKKRNTSGNIELDSFEKLKDSGLVYGSNAKCWFNFDDGRVLFKEYDNDLEAFAEVLYSKVANRNKINCAVYDFASYRGKIGTISYDVAYGDDKVAIDGLTLFSRYNPDHLPDIIRKRTDNLEVISMFNKKYNNYAELSKVFEKRYPEDLDVLQKELVEKFILDVLFDHVDNNLWNLLIVTNQYGNKPHVFSIDISHIACLYRGEEYIKDAISSLLASDGSLTIEDYLRGGVYGYDVDVKDRHYNPAKDLIDFYYSCNDAQREELTRYVKNLDISEALEETNKLHKIDPIIITWINAVFNSRKSFILKKFYHINDDYKDDRGVRNFHLRIKR